MTRCTYNNPILKSDHPIWNVLICKCCGQVHLTSKRSLLNIKLKGNPRYKPICFLVAILCWNPNPMDYIGVVAKRERGALISESARRDRARVAITRDDSIIDGWARGAMPTFFFTSLFSFSLPFLTSYLSRERANERADSTRVERESIVCCVRVCRGEMKLAGRRGDSSKCRMNEFPGGSLSLIVRLWG